MIYNAKNTAVTMAVWSIFHGHRGARKYHRWQCVVDRINAHLRKTGRMKSVRDNLPPKLGGTKV